MTHVAASLNLKECFVVQCNTFANVCRALFHAPHRNVNRCDGRLRVSLTTTDLTRSHFETQDSIEGGMPVAPPGAALSG